MSSSALHLKAVDIVMTGTGQPLTGADVIVEDGRIKSVGTALTTPAGARVIDGRGMLLAPGFVNAHWHSPMQLSAGTADRLHHKAFMWLNQADTANRTHDEIYLSAMVGCIAMLKAGVTSVIDHFPEQGFDADDVGAVVRAFMDAGQRAVVALRIFDGPYADILPPADKTVPELASLLAEHNPLAPRPADESLAICDEAIRRYDRTADRIRVFPAPSNPMRCTDKLITAAHDLARRHDTGVHCHLLETRVQSEIAHRQYGRSMVAHLEALGALSERWSCAHCNWLDDGEIELMATRKAVAVFNPESNLKIGSGIPNIPKLLAAGVPTALGADGVSTNDDLVMQDAMMLAAILHRPHEPDRRKWTSVDDVLRMATTGGARAMLERELGTIAPGQKADLVLYDLDAPHWTPLNDPAQQLVFAEKGQTVRLVVVAGRVVVENGSVVGIDEKMILREARKVLANTRARNGKIQRIADLVAAVDG